MGIIARLAKLLGRKEKKEEIVYTEKDYRKLMRDAHLSDEHKAQAIPHLVAIAKQGKHRTAIINRMIGILSNEEESKYGWSTGKAAWVLG